MSMNSVQNDEFPVHADSSRRLWRRTNHGGQRQRLELLDASWILSMFSPVPSSQGRRQVAWRIRVPFQLATAGAEASPSASFGTQAHRAARQLVRSQSVVKIVLDRSQIVNIVSCLRDSVPAAPSCRHTSPPRCSPCAARNLRAACRDAALRSPRRNWTTTCFAIPRVHMQLALRVSGAGFR